jgi:hypothetical protein
MVSEAFQDQGYGKCDKMSTPPFFLYFCAIFPYQNTPMCHGQGTHRGTSGKTNLEIFD